MPLFGSQRDASAVIKMNREIMQSIVSVEVALYKIAPNETQYNIYGESSKKAYYSPIRLFAYITLNPKTVINSAVTQDLDSTSNIQIGFLREDLLEQNIVIEVSDIVKHNNEYYHIDNVSSHELWFNRDPNTIIGQVENDFAGTGYNVSVLADAHLTSIANLNIIETRSGTKKINRLNIPRDI